MSRIACVMLIALSATVSTGCQQPLFPADTPRNQFELHNQMRGRSVPLEEPDVFGNPRPALRARLSQTR